MAILAKLAVLPCALLGGLFSLAGAPNAASAHPGHNHAPTAVHSPARVPVAVEPAAPIEERGRQLRSAVIERSAHDDGTTIRLASKLPKTPKPFYPANCCCG